MGRVGGNGYKILEGEVGCFRQSDSDIVEYCTGITMRTTTSQETLTTPRCDIKYSDFHSPSSLTQANQRFTGFKIK